MRVFHIESKRRSSMAKKKITKKVNHKVTHKTEGAHKLTHKCSNCGCSPCTCCNWNHKNTWIILPLRFALGMMFLVAGLQKLTGLIGGSTQTISFFTSIGIPAAGFSAWLVAWIETVGGIFLILGLFNLWSGLVLGIIMLVALLTTTVSPWDWGGLTKHLVYITSLFVIMFNKIEWTIFSGWRK